MYIVHVSHDCYSMLNVSHDCHVTHCTPSTVRSVPYGRPHYSSGCHIVASSHISDHSDERSPWEGERERERGRVGIRGRKRGREEGERERGWEGEREGGD